MSAVSGVRDQGRGPKTREKKLVESAEDGCQNVRCRGRGRGCKKDMGNLEQPRPPRKGKFRLVGVMKETSGKPGLSAGRNQTLEI